ncbi:dihydrolipoyl dehydrogenase family protein [Reinekea marinisedimentorum]|uniref:Pyruvate/2-oxoglutarate dehydrogenase complex dihydrolipoamide dehydrogenase (E3) component n=1 Tax=Reinekea marinisedimentorum TaxID=230495 RepID=A0A4R3I510_9GAMM|nr:FAD-dependent oxidoreductase [Reinekea marinisedimentorum]TCS40332.1 pyruvate/2-oxoglutarate dehydrogenase complex dihydrolipoamide dehydrogenase (E3) component [Reinekea marinisedimentorum]
MKKFDLIVIGSGAAGLTSAFTALGFGKSVLIIEKHKSGGECTWSGCIPSKGLINQAKDVYTAKKFASIEVDSGTILQNVRAISEGIYEHETPEVLEKAGAVFVQGAAVFESAKVIRVGETKYKAKKVVIATGSSPMVPPIPGLDTVPFLTNDNFFEQQQLPKSIIVLGAGAIGMELSQSMNRLDVDVTVVEMMPEVMFREEPEFSKVIREKLTKEGVHFHIGTKAVGVEKTANGIALSVEKDGNNFILEAESLLVALGRSPNIQGMNLEAAGIKTERGIVVDATLQTSAKGVYACGDVAGPYLLSHMANYQGKIATMNALLPINRKVNYEHVSWTTFTDPEFARAGLTEAEAREQHGDNIRVYHYDFNKLDRAKTKAGDQGQIKLITNQKGKVLGAHIIGERAGELIAEVQTVKTLGINFAKLQGVIHPYPTYADALRQMAQQVFIDNLLNLPVVKLFRKSK